MSDSDTIVRKEILFFGYVQGVGFRYTAQHAARSCGVTGWVHNEWDGSVRMEAQGSVRQINEMLKMINSGPYIKIHRMEDRQLPLEEYESGFHVH